MSLDAKSNQSVSSIMSETIPLRKLKIRKPRVNNETQMLMSIIDTETKKEVHMKSIHDSIKESMTKTEECILEHLGDYIEEPYQIIESYFEGKHLDRLVRHQIESYNNFINYQIQRTIDMFNSVKIHSENDYIEEKSAYMLECSVTFKNFKLYPPQIHENNGATRVMLPQEAKLRNFTYASTMTIDIDIVYTIRNTECMEVPRVIKKTMPKINIGKMPIMLKSSICVLNQNNNFTNTQLTGECSMDSGGYFIIKGSEKTVIGQERAAENRIYCFNSKKSTKWSWTAEIKSVPDFKCISPKQVEMMISSKNNGFGYGIYVTLPRMKQPVELFVLFRALGINTDKDICKHILLDIDADDSNVCLHRLHASIVDANEYISQDAAIDYLTTYALYTPINMDRETGIAKKREFTVDVLENDLFPHCKTKKQKIYLLGYMTHKLLSASLSWIDASDRDSYCNKRIELTGTLLNNLFRNYFNKLVKEMQKQIVREINTGSWRSSEDYGNIINMTNIYKILKSTTIENGINRALSTGDFSIKQSNSSKVGVAQVLNRLTYVSSLSHLRRINTPLEKSGELIAPRKLHNTTWGFLCLTGDTEVLMSDRLTIKKIKDIKDGDVVSTVNPKTLFDEPSGIHSFFSKMPDRLFEITTISGRKVKATANHPFLVNNAGKYEWKNLEELGAGDKLITRHITKNLIDTNETFVNISDTSVLEHYKLELLELNLLNVDIPTYKLKIIARLIGALNTDGHLHERIDKNKQYYSASFYLGEDADVFQVVDDISAVGFGNSAIKRKTTRFDNKVSGRTTTYRTWEVSNSGVFAYFMVMLGAFIGKKTNMSRSIPSWLMNSELSIKKEFLSSFQGGDGSRMSYQKNDNTWKPHLGITFQTTHNDYLEDTVKYMSQIQTIFQEFGITSNIKTTIVDDDKSKVCIVFGNGSENLAKYADIINYSYCEEKRRTSAPVIEHLKIKEFNKVVRDEHYNYIIKNHKTVKISGLIENTGLTENQIRKVISKNKNGIRQTTRFSSDIIYETFIKDNVVNNGCVSVPILSIREIEPELVYDFTTRSDNHSFVASSFVTHNCPAETPEGQSIGIVKNISYMAHITIPTNSSGLYNYIAPYIRSFDDIADSHELHNKVKVFINGAWQGITDTPNELYTDLKQKKYTGIINIYTSIVFDYKTLEIRVCSDGGRLTRPVLRVKNNNAVITTDIINSLVDGKLTWNDLLTNCNIDESVIEYIDPEEQNYAMIAMKSKESYLHTNDTHFQYTHCEIHTSTIFGVLASCVPFPDHNQAPRNTYQCLHPKEEVWMASGIKKPIGEIKIGEKVLSFHPMTMEITATTVCNHFVRKNEYPIRKVTTISGREIIATEDHKFMTNHGWSTVGDMMQNTSLKIGVCMSNYTNNIVHITDNKLIIDEKSFFEKMRDLNIVDRTNCNVNKTEQYVNDLINNNLLPMYYTNDKLCILARIIGFLYANGSINTYEQTQTDEYINNEYQCSFDFGQMTDAVQFNCDVVQCGFKPSQIISGIHAFSCTYTGCFPLFLMAICASYCKYMTNPHNNIPEWIMETPAYGMQFMKGFQGGNGCKMVDYMETDPTAYSIRTTNTKRYVHPDCKEYLIEFMQQCQQLLHQNGIHTTGPIHEEHITDDSICISYTISSHHENLIRYLDTIGYAYAQTKNNQSFQIVEYLKSKRLHGDNYIDFNEWQSNTSVHNDFLFINVKSITPEPDGMISDIEVDSENHSFIASQFASSNCAMGKQAMGVYATNYDQRMDKTAYVLNYPSRPLVDTRIMNFLHLNKIPSGTQIHVAIMTHTGYNQEDSVLINQGSIDRGLFLATIYHTEKDEDKNIIRDEIIRCKPDPAKTKGIKFGNYDKLNADGFLPVNERVENRDVIIAKIVPIKENRNDPTKTVKYEDQSKTYRTNEDTYIDKNFTGRNGDGYNFAKVRMRVLRKPTFGDKFSSRHGQKGTAGNIIPECDMPFTSSGLRPDIIINPHAIPSRMTIGQLKETLLGKVLLELGMFGDGTSFGNLDVKTISQELLKLGYESYGNELMYNGLTGEQLETNIFIGPVFYQRLKHMVADKQHSRSIGPMVNLTRQPAEGRSRDGGFRIGEMERDVMIAHGMTRFCKERLYDVSDKYNVHVCKKCGMIASYNDGNKSKLHTSGDFSIHFCKTCDNRTDFAKVDIPYAYKLMSQELQTINIVPRIITE